MTSFIENYCIEDDPSSGAVVLTIQRNEKTDGPLQQLYDLFLFAVSTGGDVIDTDANHAHLHNLHCPQPTTRHYHTKFANRPEAERVLNAILAVTPEQIRQLKADFLSMANEIKYTNAVASIHEIDCDFFVNPSIQIINHEAAKLFFEKVSGQINHMRETGAPLMIEPYEINSRDQNHKPSNELLPPLCYPPRLRGTLFECPRELESNQGAALAAVPLLPIILLSLGIVGVLLLISYLFLSPSSNDDEPKALLNKSSFVQASGPMNQGISI